MDQVAELLEAQGIDNYLVEVGGEVRGRGHNRLGERWRIAIERPSIGQRSVQRFLHITDRAIATSGGYRNFFEYRGRRYSHVTSKESSSGSPKGTAIEWKSWIVPLPDICPSAATNSNSL